ncbi:MAG: PulJ/GspJ family protein, partial [Pirellulales bacterium]
MNCLTSLSIRSPSNCCLTSRKAFGRHGSRSAMTLVEMLVATALTLVMMALVAQLFGMLGKGVNGSRNRVELYSRLRATGYRLKQDLAGVTVELTPPIDPE